jgi:trigger factor
LKIEKEFLDDHQVKLTVEFDPDPLEKAKRQAARKLAQRSKIPGFRPGKAPYGVILKQFGEGAIIEDALDILIQEQYPKVIEEADIQPYGPGALENVPTLDPPTFEFIIPLDAKVELADYKKLDIPYSAPKVTEDDVNAEIEKLRQQHAVRESVDRPAEEGDVVFMRVSGKKAEMENEEDDGVLIEERFSSAVIKSKEDKDKSEWPFSGFSRKLIGVTAEDTKTTTHTYPKSYEDEKLRGLKVNFTVNVTNVQSQSLPALDDEFAKTASDFDTFDELIEDTNSRLVREFQEKYDTDYDEQILDHLVAESSIKYPPQMLETEKAEMLKSLEYNLSRQGINKELYLQIRGLTEDELDNEITPAAETRLKRSLVMLEVAAAENIQIDQEKLNSQASRTVELITSRMSRKEAKDFHKSDYISNLVNNMVADMMTQKTMQYLRAVAKGEPWPPEEETEPVAEIDEVNQEEAPTQESDTALEAKEKQPQEAEQTTEGIESVPQIKEKSPEDK